MINFTSIAFILRFLLDVRDLPCPHNLRLPLAFVTLCNVGLKVVSPHRWSQLLDKSSFIQLLLQYSISWMESASDKSSLVLTANATVAMHHDKASLCTPCLPAMAQVKTPNQSSCSEYA
jgi:hypothetical protein